MSGKINVEKIIEEVRRYPALYDQWHDKYRNVEYKDKIWRQISNNLRVEGGPSACKAKWTHVRDQFRKTLKKRKNIARRGIGTNIRKYKFEDILQFLLPHLTERDSISNVPISKEGDGDKEEPNECCDEDTEEATFEREGSGSETDEGQGEPEIANNEQKNKSTNSGTKCSQIKRETPAKPTQVKRKTIETNNICHKNTSNKQTSFTFDENIAEKRMKELPLLYHEQLHPVDAFLTGISYTLKTLNPVFLNKAKSGIFSVVQELEMQQLVNLPPISSDRPLALGVYSHLTSPADSSGSFRSPSPTFSSPTPPPPEPRETISQQPKEIKTEQVNNVQW